MAWQSMGVLSPGEVGGAVATVLCAHGLRVVTHIEGRSVRTRQRAEAARLEVVPSLAQLVRTVEACEKAEEAPRRLDAGRGQSGVE
jgi:hypothetical protein